MTGESNYFTDIYQRFKSLSPGVQAPMRRVAAPDDLRETPGLYRLFPGSRPSDKQVQAAFIIPWCRNLSGTQKLGPLCADRIGEARIIQIARTSTPADLIAFRRIVIQLQPSLGWLEVAPLVYAWGPEIKRDFVEAYFIVLHKLDRGAKP